MNYTVQRGDTIAKVTSLLGTDWQTLKRMNPTAVGQSKKNGNWFVREGKTLSVRRPFEQHLQDSRNQAMATQHLQDSRNRAMATQHLQDSRNQAMATQSSKPSPASTGGPGELMHTVQPGDTVWELAVKRYHVDPDDILSLNNITDPRRLQPGMKLRIPVPEKPEPREVVASWYGSFHHGRPMANGEPYDMYGATIAHKEMPLGTRVELENPETGQRVRATVTDRGPYVAGREVDLSYQLARQLSLVERGVGTLTLRVL